MKKNFKKKKLKSLLNLPKMERITFDLIRLIHTSKFTSVTLKINPQLISMQQALI